MKIVVLDGYTENPGDLSWEPLKALGELTVYERTSLTDPQEAIARIGDAEIVLTNKTPMKRDVIMACPNLRYIALFATGYNIVDVEAAAERGIPVSNVPSYGTEAVAQFAIGLLLELCHHVSDHSRTVHAGDWAGSLDFCYWNYPVIELAGLTMGIIGFGRIGRQVGRIAKAMGMKVIAYSPHESEEGKEIGDYVNLDTLLAQSDVISLHCPLNAANKKMINKDTIAKMKDGVILINNSRGGLVNEQDLADALNSGKVYAAGLDVVSVEPILPTNPLLGAKNCLITPHISWAAKTCRQRILDTTCDNIRAFREGKPINVVNR